MGPFDSDRGATVEYTACRELRGRSSVDFGSIGRNAGIAFALGTLFGALPALGQTSPPQTSVPQTSAPASRSEAEAAPSGPSSPWTFRFTGYGWLVFLSGSQTVKGHSVTVDTNVFQMFDKSQSLIPFMGYFEARYQDRIALFLDVMYMNLTAYASTARDFTLGSVGNAGVIASASGNYETLTMQFGGAYEVTRVGPDRSAEGPGMSGVGQTAFDVMLGGRYWYQRADITLNLNGSLAVNTPDLEFSADRTRAYSRSGSVNWVDPFVGGRIRHRLAPGQELEVEADIGGFGIGSRISWQALAAYSFNIGNTGGVNWAGVVGYRALYVDYSQGSGSSLYELNMLQHGPLFGVSARF
jgi:hypothetical protein